MILNNRAVRDFNRQIQQAQKLLLESAATLRQAEMAYAPSKVAILQSAAILRRASNQASHANTAMVCAIESIADEVNVEAAK